MQNLIEKFNFLIRRLADALANREIENWGFAFVSSKLRGFEFTVFFKCTRPSAEEI